MLACLDARMLALVQLALMLTGMRPYLLPLAGGLLSSI